MPKRNRKARPEPEVTAFLISVSGCPNRDATLEALQRQTPTVPIIEIRNVAPMDRAFQQMLDLCKTPYFVQVDSDMNLNQDAIAKMLATMKTRPDKVAFGAWMLYDRHLDMPIQGVKCYRTAIMQKYPYTEGISCERSQSDRMRADGYTIYESNELLGFHSLNWTPELIFERYYDLMLKWRKFGYYFLEDLPAKFLAKHLNSRSEIDKYAYLGVLAGIMAATIRPREKDFRIRTPEYLTARSWHSHPTSATFFLTGTCTLRCRWCMRQGDNPPPAAKMFYEGMVDEVVSRFPTIKSACLCGFGEPFLHPNVFKIIARCREKKLYTNLITNGTLLLQRLPEMLLHRPDQLSVSLNAATAEEHAYETQCPGMWDTIIHGIRLTVNTGQPVYLSRVCTAGNLDGVGPFLKLADELNVTGVDLHNLLPHDVGTPEKLQAFLGSVLTVKHAEQLQSLKSLPGAHRVRSWPVLIDPDCPTRRCDLIFSTIAVDGDGNISICNSIYPPKQGNGRIHEPKIWRGDYAEAFRQQFAAEELPVECKYCFRNYQ